MYLKICPVIKLLSLKNTQMTILQNYYVKTFEDVKLQNIQFVLWATISLSNWQTFVSVLLSDSEIFPSVKAASIDV